MKIKLFTHRDNLPINKKIKIASFLFKYLEQYRDSEDDIRKAIDYALSDSACKGGFILAAEINTEIVGIVVVNQTGMDGYIPENILVYIATRNDLRGQGIGKTLLQRVIETAQGDIALHVEPNNPARFLYLDVGFENKYTEMRLIKK